MLRISLKRLSPDGRLPKRATEGSFGYDLATMQEEVIDARGTRILPCGFQLAHDLPLSKDAGLAMMILPRSSLPLQWGLILPNAPGLVDADYAGPLGIIVHNLTEKRVVLPAGTRIAQAVFIECRLPEIGEADEADPKRDRGGFGSTGV